MPRPLARGRDSSPRHPCSRYRPTFETLEDRRLPDASYWNLAAGPFFQDWSNLPTLVTRDNDWSGVPSVMGYRGDGLVSGVGVDPQTVVNFAGSGGPVVNVMAHKTNPDTLSTGGLAAFEIANPVVGLKGSGTAKAPFLLFSVNTVGVSNVTISYNLRDIDGSAHSAVEPYALQYRVGETGPFTNLPAGYVPGATTGPYEAYLVTPVSVALPADAVNQPRVQIRVITTDAVGYDEWVGVDDISITGNGSGGPNPLRIVTYNVDSPDGNGLPRPGMDTLLQAIGNEPVNGISEPIDILAMQEIKSQATTAQAVVDLLNNLYGPGTYARGSLNGASTGSGTVGVVYNTQTVQLLSEVAIGTASSTGQPRQDIRYLFHPLQFGPGADFYLYVSHYKADQDSTSQNRRLVEAQAVRADADALGPGIPIIYAGDYNVYTSNEAGYQRLLAPGNGQAFDPLNQPGSWSNNAAYLPIFSEAPAVSPPPPLTGGGLHNRFDFQLQSAALSSGFGLNYEAGSYHSFGNNGTVPLRGNINDPSNTALQSLPNGSQVLDLLTTVSDHLPVVADYVYASGASPRTGTGTRGGAHGFPAATAAALAQVDWTAAGRDKVLPEPAIIRSPVPGIGEGDTRLQVNLPTGEPPNVTPDATVGCLPVFVNSDELALSFWLSGEDESGTLAW